MKEKFINPYSVCHGNVVTNCSDDVFDREDFLEVSINELGVLVKQPCTVLPNELDGSAFDLDPKDPTKFQKVDMPITLGSLEDQVANIESYLTDVKSNIDNYNKQQLELQKQKELQELEKTL